jgi:hypothetical protein
MLAEVLNHSQNKQHGTLRAACSTQAVCICNALLKPDGYTTNLLPVHELAAPLVCEQRVANHEDGHRHINS